MAKGKTTKPLVIWVHGPWVAREEIRALAAAGHIVAEFPDAGEAPPDLVLHPSAHMWGESLFAHPVYLEVAMKAARKRQQERA